jgi:hypothetical protein
MNNAEAGQIEALLLPYFFYYDIFFSHLSSVDSRRLQVAFNSCTRCVFNLRRYDHLSTRRNDLLGLPLFDYYDFRVLSFFFKVILTQRPGYLFAELIGARSARTSNFIFSSVSPGLRCWLREFVCGTNCRWLLTISVRLRL